MTIKEMINKLVAVCDTVSTISCCIGHCPMFKLCNLSPHSPENKSGADIIEMYNEAVRQGLIKED